MEINTKDELLKVITDLQGTMANMQETIDKLSPVSEEPPADTTEETPEEPTEDIDELDKLLHES